ISGMKALGERDILGLETALAEDGRPRDGGVAAPQEFLIDGVVARAAVAGRELRDDGEAVMILTLLSGSRLMAIEAVDALSRVRAQLVFVDDRILLGRMALGALAGGPHEGGGGLLDVHPWPRAIDHERADDESERDDDRDEHRAERHSDSIKPRDGDGR